MSYLNKVQIIGRLGNDPEIRYMPNGNAVANISVATTEKWKDPQGQRQERTEWHKITLYKRQAEIAGEYLKKGSQAYFEGKLQTRKWQDQQGQDRYTTEIVGDRMLMLESRQNNPGGYQQPNQQAQNSPPGQQNNQGGSQQGNTPPTGQDFDFDDDIPF